MTNKIELIEIKSQARYWLVRADGGRYYDQFKYEHFISVHHNEMKVSDFYSNELLLTEAKTIQYYKEQIANKHKNDNLSKHQITFIAKKLYNFLESMAVGDYVVVPSRHSNYFLIGQIINDVEEIENVPDLELNHGYDRNEDLKRRAVKWINEVPRRKFNAKFLYSTLTLHHSIIEITDYAKYIDALISPIYIKDGRINLKLNVNTEKPINSEMWSSLYSMIEDNKTEEEIVVTSNVESPGDINLSSAIQLVNDSKILIASGVGIIASLFGDIDYKGSKIKGLFPYLRDRKKSKLEERSLLVDVETKEKDAKLNDIKRQIEIEKSRKILQDIRDLDISIDAPNVFYENEFQKQTDLDENLDEE